MKMPASPPDIYKFLSKMPPERIGEILVKRQMVVDDAGRYLHWDEMRFRPPPPGLSPEEWWVAVRLARNAAAQLLPLFAKPNAQFSYTEPPNLRASLRFIDMHAGGALGSGKHGLSADDGRYLRRSLAEEPFSSSYLEGAATTRDIAKKLIFENKAPRTRDERMVYNNYRGMEFIKLHQHEQLTPSLILELHKIITEKTLDNEADAGRIRTNDDNVAVVDDSNGEILHLPPPADELNERMDRLCQFVNTDDDDIKYCHPVLRAIILHFMLAYDHPFVDGNGRTARALFYWALLRARYWLMEYVSISSVILESPVAYYRSFLLTETDNNDLTYFLLNQTQTLQRALEKLHQYADRKRLEAEEFHRLITEQSSHNSLNARQISFIHQIYNRQITELTVDEYKQLNSVSYLTARNDLEDLLHRQLVKKIRKRHSFSYQAGDSLKSRLHAITGKKI